MSQQTFLVLNRHIGHLPQVPNSHAVSVANTCSTTHSIFFVKHLFYMGEETGPLEPCEFSAFLCKCLSILQSTRKPVAHSPDLQKCCSCPGRQQEVPPSVSGGSRCCSFSKMEASSVTVRTNYSLSYQGQKGIITLRTFLSCPDSYFVCLLKNLKACCVKFWCIIFNKWLGIRSK